MATGHRPERNNDESVNNNKDKETTVINVATNPVFDVLFALANCLYKIVQEEYCLTRQEFSRI